MATKKEHLTIIDYFERGDYRVQICRSDIPDKQKPNDERFDKVIYEIALIDLKDKKRILSRHLSYKKTGDTRRLGMTKVYREAHKTYEWMETSLRHN